MTGRRRGGPAHATGHFDPHDKTRTYALPRDPKAGPVASARQQSPRLAGNHCPASGKHGAGVPKVAGGAAVAIRAPVKMLVSMQLFLSRAHYSGAVWPD